MGRLVVIMTVVTMVTVTLVRTSPVPQNGVWFMCDMCEGGWIGCVVRCPVEQYLTKHKFNR